MSSGTARIVAVLFLVFGFALGVFDAPEHWNKAVARMAEKAPFVSNFAVSGPLVLPYRLGLDIRGGTHLVYRADLSAVASDDPASSMDALRDVIERRVNLFGVAEPVVQVERSGSEQRLIVELAGISDISEAIRLIGETPYLEFKEELPTEERLKIMSGYIDETTKDIFTPDILCQNAPILGQFILQFGVDPCFRQTELTGRHIERADVAFQQTASTPYIGLALTSEGTGIFSELTKRNLNKILAIYLDGVPISLPTVQSEITDGRAQITGTFTPEEARTFAGRLNAGALPVPIELISQQSIGASLGAESLARSLDAGAWGVAAVALFMILWYRLPGLLAVVALGFYTAAVLAVFKFIPVTLTVAGIAGFILSVGMAVDANVLIFERMKEELRRGRALREAMQEGFRRAWTSIRDSNTTSLIICAILYWFGTSIIQGFALTLAIGILVSMFSAISVTRTFLIALSMARFERIRSVFLSGVSR